jgi:hypothetical protein
LREVPEPALDPRLAGGLRWQDMPNALQRLQDRDVTGKLVLTLGP